MAVSATAIFRAHPECFDAETVEEFLDQGESPFAFDRLRYVTRVEESKRINDLHGPCIIISSSGMAEAGRVLHHLLRGIGDPRNTVLFVGFQAAATLGRRLVEGPRRSGSSASRTACGPKSGRLTASPRTPTTARSASGRSARSRAPEGGLPGARRAGRPGPPGGPLRKAGVPRVEALRRVARSCWTDAERGGTRWPAKPNATSHASSAPQRWGALCHSRGRRRGAARLDDRLRGRARAVATCWFFVSGLAAHTGNLLADPRPRSPSASPISARAIPRPCRASASRAGAADRARRSRVRRGLGTLHRALPGRRTAARPGRLRALPLTFDEVRYVGGFARRRALGENCQGGARGSGSRRGPRSRGSRGLRPARPCAAASRRAPPASRAC